MKKEKIEYYVVQFSKIKSVAENEKQFYKVLFELIKCNIEIECNGINVPEDIKNRLFYTEYNELKPLLENYLGDKYGKNGK
ncbi:hypothetical protein MUU49_00080 [Scandinavium goeteborgense]|uniref:hypothetical protein n=1 Tax=Scandinavium goeteborgense TaxID=1851514 RepID=UPI0021650627|nr:hypothetical protein [Scandinavium goeteborgense]MCS2151018.1 hypothetical protein [Scandinavium goeteborgense]